MVYNIPNHNVIGMEALQQNRLKGRRLLVEALGYATSNVNEKPKTFNDGECTICLTRLDKAHSAPKLTLPCGHIFHGECICQWANFKNENLTLDAIFPTQGRRISYFKQGQYTFSCPTCRDEFAGDVFDRLKIKKVIAKVHALYNGDTCIHYITDPLELLAYIPKSELTKDGKIAVRWGYYTEALNKLWRAGHTDVWATKEEGGQFLLNSNYKQFERITKDGKRITGQRPPLQIVDLDELQELLNAVK